MVCAVTTNSSIPEVASGPILYRDGSVASDCIRSLKRYKDMYQANNKGGTYALGANMAANLTPDALENVLALTHIWPGEDKMLEKIIKDSQGMARHQLDPRALVATSARYLPSLFERFVNGADATQKNLQQDYVARAAPGSMPLDEYLRHHYMAPTMHHERSDA